LQANLPKTKRAVEADAGGIADYLLSIAKVVKKSRLVCSASRWVAYVVTSRAALIALRLMPETCIQGSCVHTTLSLGYADIQALSGADAVAGFCQFVELRA